MQFSKYEKVHLIINKYQCKKTSLSQNVDMAHLHLSHLYFIQRDLSHPGIENMKDSENIIIIMHLGLFSY